MDVVDLDPVVRRNLVHSEAGSAWVAGLQTVVSRLVEEWGLDRLGTACRGGSHSLVAPVILREGSEAVLKIPFVDDENRLEAEALKLYDRDGAIELFAFDELSGAMLLERASPGTPLEHHPDRSAAIGICCALLRRLRRPPPAGHRFTLATDTAREWRRHFGTQLEKTTDPAKRMLLVHAAAAADGLARSSGPAFLVNRDAHLGNVLASRRQPWLLIDPKPLVGDPAFDAGYLADWLIGDDPSPAYAEQIVGAVAAGLGVRQEGVRGWAVIRAMDNYLWALDERQGDDPTPYLREAAALMAIE